jgi:hypothetical protein
MGSRIYCDDDNHGPERKANAFRPMETPTSVCAAFTLKAVNPQEAW